MCKDLLLIIEGDGYSHIFKETIDKDIKKEKVLEEVGYKVLRLHDEEVLNDMDNVIRELECQVEIRRNELGIPPPDPRQRGK